MKTSFVILSVLILSACGAVYAPNPMRGHIALMADAEGMRAFSDSQIGLVNEGKTGKNIKSSYFQHRDLTEEETTKRAYAPSLLQNLFGSTQEEK